MVSSYFLEQAKNKKDSVAIKTRTGTWTYGQVSDEIHQVIDLIQKMDLSVGELVGLGFSNSVEGIVTLFACELTGHPAVLLGKYLKPREVLFNVEKLGLRKTLADKGLRTIFEETGACIQENDIYSIDCWNFNVPIKNEKLKKEDFIIQLTSGTNGIPKVVARTSDSVMQEIQDTYKQMRLCSDDIIMTIPPIHHSYGLIGGTLMPLCLGQKLILLDGFIPDEVINLVENEKVTVLFAVPFMYNLLNQSVKQRKIDFSSLKLCLSAGASLPEDVEKQFKECTGQYIYQDYGSTETGLMCLNMDPKNRPRTVGLPIGNSTVKAFDEQRKELPPGVIGELWIKSKATARAYMYPEELNETAYFDDWFSVGDIGYVSEDGYVYVKGRKSNMINVAGMKVDPAEVEVVISKIPGVKEVVVLGIDSNSSGQVVKAVILKEKNSLDETTIIKYCMKNLSGYKVPRVIDFIEEIPRNQTGKILRKYLA